MFTNQGLLNTRACFINMLGKRAVEAPNFSWGSGFFRTRENSGSHPISGFSPGPESY